MAYIGAPYNFISLPEKVYERYPALEALPKHHEIKEELLSGEISYHIKAESDIFVGGSNKEEFYKGTNGKYAIPGSSIRGLIRNNVQILGLGSIEGDTEDFRLMYRQVGMTGRLADKYKRSLLGASLVTISKGVQVTVCKNVRAGYLKKQNGKYVIYKTKQDSISSQFGKMNYYAVRENVLYDEKRKIVNNTKNGTIINPFELMTDNGKMQLLDECEITTNKSGRKKNKYIQENKDYKPYSKAVSYNLEGTRKITAIGKPGVYKNEGFVLSSGKMKRKKVFYIIPEIGSQYITIPEQDVLSFQRDYEGKKKQLGDEDVQEFFALPDEGDIKPVFYIQYGKKKELFFGFTQYLRVFYRHSIGEGIPEENKRWKLDYAKAIFGFTSEAGSYKGRVYFEDASVQNNVEEKQEELMLQSPKPSSYLDYLVQQEGKISTYDEPFEIRGIKQYWLKNAIAESANIKTKVSSKFRPLKSGAHFVGKIHFKNLAKDELGLLLWSLQLEADCRQNIGKAKPYGYGKILVHNIQIKLFDYSKMYTADTIDFSPFGSNLKAADYINSYKQYISSETNQDIMKYPGIQEFFRMKDNLQIPDNSRTKYMSVDAKDYQNRKTPLCTPLQINEAVRNQQKSSPK